MTTTELFGHLVRFVHAVSQRGTAILGDHGLSPAQYQLLLVLSAHPGIAQYQLADRVGVTRGNVSQLVKKLEASGVIARRRDASTDELTLTDCGRDLVAALRPQQESFMALCFAALDAGELRQLKHLMAQLNADARR